MSNLTHSEAVDLITVRLQTLSTFTKTIMESRTMKGLFVVVKACLKQLFNYQSIFLLIKSEEFI